MAEIYKRIEVGLKMLILVIAPEYKDKKEGSSHLILPWHVCKKQLSDQM